MKYKAYNAKTRGRIPESEIKNIFKFKNSTWAEVKGLKKPIRVILEKKDKQHEKAKSAFKAIKTLYPSLTGLCISYGDNEMDIINS